MSDDLEQWVSRIAAWASTKDTIAEVWIFGSRARGDHRADSDLDVALVMSGNSQSERYNNWFFDSEDWQLELQRLVPVPVDLDLGDADISTTVVGPAIRREGRRIFCRTWEGQ